MPIGFVPVIPIPVPQTDQSQDLNNTAQDSQFQGAADTTFRNLIALTISMLDGQPPSKDMFNALRQNLVAFARETEGLGVEELDPFTPKHSGSDLDAQLRAKLESMLADGIQPGELGQIAALIGLLGGNLGNMGTKIATELDKMVDELAKTNPQALAAVAGQLQALQAQFPDMAGATAPNGIGVTGAMPVSNSGQPATLKEGLQQLIDKIDTLISKLGVEADSEANRLEHDDTIAAYLATLMTKIMDAQLDHVAGDMLDSLSERRVGAALAGTESNLHPPAPTPSDSLPLA